MAAASGPTASVTFGTQEEIAKYLNGTAWRPTNPEIDELGIAASVLANQPTSSLNARIEVAVQAIGDKLRERGVEDPSVLKFTARINLCSFLGKYASQREAQAKQIALKEATKAALEGDSKDADARIYEFPSAAQLEADFAPNFPLRGLPIETSKKILQRIISDFADKKMTKKEIDEAIAKIAKETRAGHSGPEMIGVAKSILTQIIFPYFEFLKKMNSASTASS